MAMELPVARRRFGAILALLLLIGLPQAEAGVGRTPGYASVSPDGEAEYTIPLDLPPGTNGMTPVVTLDYRHRTKSGLLGVGWSIGGISQIVRCPRTIAQDGIAATSALAFHDRFCLDGQRLVVLNQLAYDAPGAEYRTEIESFSRIRSVPGGGNGPDYFVVEAADGRTYEYGATPDSRIDGQASTSSIGARTWALNRIRDRAGNVIDYEYFEERPGSGFRISKIRYNANPGAGIAASHQLAFVYENRPNNDIDTGYIAGTPVRQIVRLDRIDVLYNGAVLRRYELNYEPALSTGGRSRLASLQACAAGGPDCLAATTLEWQNGTPGFAATTTVTAALPGPAFNPVDSSFVDITGDGRLDYVWAGGASMSTATIRYRLGTPVGLLGPEINTGIPCPYGIGRRFDSNGDARADLLTISTSGIFNIIRGTATGLGTAVPTGVAIPSLARDFRGLDLNGDGLGDIAWSETDPTYSSMLVRVSYALASGGFQTPVTLYSQEESAGYTGAQGGEFLGRAGRVDLNGDGAEDLLMNENVAIVGISYAGHSTTSFDSTYQSGIGLVLDFNDDGCSDFAYKHLSGTLRVRVGGCGTSWNNTELQGPAWTGAAALRAHDWNGDGREDILLAGTTNWQVAISNGDSFSAIVDTGLPHDGGSAITGLDIDGDGLQDLATRVGAQLRVRLKNGAQPDLLLAAQDGFGVSAEFTYSPLTDKLVYTRGEGAAYPAQDMQTSAQVVARLTTSDGSGRGWKKSTGFHYEGLRRDLRGRGWLGFRKQTVTDLVPERLLSTETLRRQDFPYTGLPESITVRHKSGKPVSLTSFQWSALSGGLLSGRRFPYAATTTSRRYEMGGAFDGSEIARRVRSVAAIDATSGLVTDETTTVTEIGGGAHAGSSTSVRTLHSSLLNDTSNWCLGKAQSIQITASHTLAGGSSLTREFSQNWDGLKCRPTQRRVEPGNSLWQVTYDLTYDAFGNLASEKVTGSGMPARTMAIAWDARGQLPIRIANPLSQLTRITWDAARGQPLTLTDPNGLVTRWVYDAFDRLARETQADGTSTTWTLDGCKGGCDARAKYRLLQADRDASGSVRVSASVEFDQHERGFRFKSQRAGGGHAISIIDSDDRGLVLRRYLPHWEGGLPPGHWYYSYDALGRKTGAQLLAPNNVPERSIRLQYDGLAVTQTNLLGQVTTGTRTAWGPLAEVIDASGGTTRYEYDASGNLLRVRDPQNNTVATIGYNPRGMKLTHADMDMGSWNWTHNALGETTSIRDAKGQVLRFEYDPLGRITRRISPEGTGTWNWGSSAANKDIGRLTGVAATGYAENFTYDAIGRPATRTIIADANYRYDYGYNTLGLLDTITYPNAGAAGAFTIRHDYDAGRVSRVRNSVAPGEAYWTLNAEDPAGNTLDESLGSAIRVVSGFKPVSDMLEYRQGFVGGTTIQNLAYDWNSSGSLTRRADLNRNLVEEFRYDSLDRLDDSRRNGVVNLELDYDAIGNILRKSDVCPGIAACYGYHATRKHAVVSAGSLKYVYDANGNMTGRGGATIAWTSDNRPVSIAHSNGNSSQFSYGPDGNRWKQVAKHGSASETTIHAGELLEKVTRSGVTTWRDYVPTPSGLAAVHLRYADGSPATMRYLLQDHLGSTDQILDASGKLVVAESFSANGRRRGANWTGVPGTAEIAKIASSTRDGFTGHEHLDNLELIHMNGRVYDPLLGRFISADPYVTLPYDGQGLNRYAYALNSPLSLIDPSGFDAPPCMESSPGNCAQVTVVGVEWVDWIRYASGGTGQVASAMERDPCGQESDAFTCSWLSGRFTTPSNIVLTVGTRSDSTLSRSRALDGAQGFAARLGNLLISSSPIGMLFGTDPDFQYFSEPGSDAGRTGTQFGNVGYFLGGAAGIIRKSGSEIASGAPSQVARSFQGNPKYPGIDRFKDITLKKGTILYSGFPGQTAFYTTQSAIRRSALSAEHLFRGLQLMKHRELGYRTRIAAYEVMSDSQAAFGLAIANIDHGIGWLPQVVVPSYQTSLRFIEDIPLVP
jgi:RHS repeat-associated protein